MDGERTTITLRVNGRSRTLMVDPSRTLASVLRDDLGLTGTKEACDEGACGSCTVLVDGVAMPSCMLLAVEQDGKSVETIEGLAQEDRLHPLQEAWLEEYGAQCGFCSPGMILCAKALLARNPHPDRAEIKEALSGKICICGNYEHIISAVENAARRMAGERT